MVENEKIIKEDIKLPDNILSESETIKVEEPNKDIAKANEIKDVSIFGTTFDVNTAKPIKEKSKIEEPKEIKVADVSVNSFNEEQTKDFNRLLELNVEPEKAKKIILGESVEVETLDTEGKSEYEVDKEILSKKGIDLDLIIKSEPEASSISEEIFVDSAGVETEGGVISTKLLYELNGYNADKDNEIKGKIRFDLGFGLDGSQFKQNNIKNLLIKQISDSGEYDKETLAKYLDQIEVKTVPLEYKDKKKQGLVYRIPKELGGTGMFAAVDSPKLSMDDLSDAVADSGPIVASIIGGTFGSTLGPLGTVAGSAVSAGLAEMARLLYGYHKLGLQNDLYTPEEFFDVASSMSMKYAAVDAAATGIFLTGAKLLLPTILGKSQLSTNTIKEFIETEGKVNKGLFTEVNKVKESMKKEFNFTQTEVDNYFAVSLGKAILNSDQLVKKGSAAQRALMSDEISRLENLATFKEMDKKILKATTGVGELGNKEADKVITNIQRQITGQAEIGIKEAELVLMKNTSQMAKLEGSFIDDLSIKYLDEFGVTLDDAYKNITARLSALDDNIAAGIEKNTSTMQLNIKEALKIINQEMKGFKFSKGFFPNKLKVKGKKPLTIKQKALIEKNNKLFRIGKLLEKGGFTQVGKEMKITYEGFKEIGKKNITLKDAFALKNSVNLMVDITEGKAQGQFKQLSKSINKNIYDSLVASNNKELADQVILRHTLLEQKRGSFFNNFNKEFGHSNTDTLKFSSSTLFNKIINTTDKSLEEALNLGALIANKTIPDATTKTIKETLYKNYFNKVIPDAVTGKPLMSHNEFFKQFGKNYEAILGKQEYKKLINTQKVINAYDSSMAAVADINGVVAKYLPGIDNWSALSVAGPGQIVEHILSGNFVKTTNLTKLLNGLPVQTVKQIRELFLTRMMKDVTTGSFTPNIVSRGGTFMEKARTGFLGEKVLGGQSTGTINGALMNKYLDANRSAILQLYDPAFFQTMRSMGDVLEMLQVPSKLAQATKTSIKDASENAALFIDMIYGPLNHKRLVLNRFARLLDKTGMNSDNILLFTDYAKFTEAAKKNFLAGNYPAWIGKLPEKERVTFIDKALRLLRLDESKIGKVASKYLTGNNLVDVLNVGLNRGAGVRKSFTKNPIKNPLVQKEYLEDKFSEMKGDDSMQDNADVFFPVDVTAKYAIKALQAVFVDLPIKSVKGVKKVFEEAEKVEDRNIEKEKFQEKLN